MYQNPMNDFYLRQAQPYQQTFNFPPQQPQIRANWVSSIEEAKASIPYIAEIIDEYFKKQGI